MLQEQPIDFQLSSACELKNATDVKNIGKDIRINTCCKVDLLLDSPA